MKGLDKATSAALVKLLIFILVTSMATAVLVVLIGNLTFQSSRNYKADFTDVAGLVEGDDVRIAGVKVGSVKAIDVIGADHARVPRDSELTRVGWTHPRAGVTEAAGLLAGEEIVRWIHDHVFGGARPEVPPSQADSALFPLSDSRTNP